MQNADTQCTIKSGEEPKGRENFLSLNFSCLAIKIRISFHTLVMVLHILQITVLLGLISCLFSYGFFSTRNQSSKDIVVLCKESTSAVK